MDTVKDILSASLKQWGVKHKYNQQSAIAHWPEIVGAEIAKHSCPIKIEYGIIVVNVANSAWCHHLSMMKLNIITKINSFLGEKLINDIRFQAGLIKNCQIEQNGYNEERIPDFRLVKLEQDEISAVNDIAGLTQNLELRDKLLRIIKKDFSLKKIKKVESWQKCTLCSTLCRPGEKYCTFCERNKRSELMSKIRDLLREAPWLKYYELNQYLKCTPSEYDDAKNYVVAVLLSAIQKNLEEPDKMALFTLTMLITCMKPEAITEEILAATLSKIRGKKNVFTSGR